MRRIWKQYFASHFVLCLIYPIFAKDKLRLGIAFKRA